MKHLIQAILFLLIVVIPVSALQDDSRLQKRLDNLREELTLSEMQTEQIRMILQHEENELNKTRELNKDDARAVDQAKRSLKEQTNQQIVNVLTNDQKKTFSAMQEKRTYDPRFLEMKEKLQLSEEQAAQIAPIMSDTHKSLEKLRDESGSDRRKMRDKMRKIIDQQDKQIEALLTDDQKSIFAEMKNERRKHDPRGGKGGRPGGQR